MMSCAFKTPETEPDIGGTGRRLSILNVRNEDSRQATWPVRRR
jgi:hypothetical protein